MKDMTVIVVFDRDFKNVLVCRREKDPWRGKYNFVGGKIEPGEEPLNSASRKLFEETGITYTHREILHRIMELTYHWPNIEPERLFVYTTVTKMPANKLKLKEEVNHLFWLSLNGLDLFNPYKFANQGGGFANMLIASLTWYLCDTWGIDEYTGRLINITSGYTGTPIPLRNETPKADRLNDVCIEGCCRYLVDDGICGGIKCKQNESLQCNELTCGSYSMITSCRTCQYAGSPNVYETGTLDGIGYTCSLQNGKEIFTDINPLLSNFSNDEECPIHHWSPKLPQKGM